MSWLYDIAVADPLIGFVDFYRRLGSTPVATFTGAGKRDLPAYTRATTPNKVPCGLQTNSQLTPVLAT
ncbi:hypothetical protein ARTHRO8AJ_90045 [Arthrobacter sp. 8AJ]|nr:hypothetical protein ARTHRO8AJ_90045 [Arthrobacter sp. 8AJ]